MAGLSAEKVNIPEEPTSVTVREHIDPTVAVENLFNELFQKVFQNDAARRQFGFAQISQSTTAEGLPRWYLWFADRDGAYSLTIGEGHILSTGRHPSGHERNDNIVVGAPLLIYYFPAIEEDIFESLSCFEQIARLGPSFDRTGTPSFEGGRTLHDSYFVAGAMDVVIHSAATDVDFYCSAPSRWRDYRLDGLTLIDEKGELHEALSPGAMDRDYPGWDLSFFLFDKIINSYCFMAVQAPRYTGTALKPSYHHVIDAKQHVDAVYDENITETIFGVSFFEDADLSFVKQRHNSFSTKLLSNEHRLIAIGETLNDMPAAWQKPDWWSIKDTHFHEDPDHICSCYEDH